MFFDEGKKLWKQVASADNAKEPKEPIAIVGETDVCGNLRSFYRAVREGSTSYTSLHDAALAVAVVFAAVTSAQEGRVVDVRL